MRRVPTILFLMDLQVGDGTTTVVILAGEFLRESKGFLEENVHPQSIIKSFREAGRLAESFINENAVTISGKDESEMRNLLIKCASTSLNSKLVPSLSFLRPENTCYPLYLHLDLI